MATERKVRKFCSVCEKENLVAWKCLNCLELQCSDCKNVHEKFSISKNHILIPLDKLSPSMMEEQKLKITSAINNQEQCDLFCINCNIRIKTADSIMEHLTHNLDSFESFNKTLRTNIDSLISKITLEVGSSKSYDDKKQMVEEKREMKREIQKRYEEIILSCKANMKSLHNDVDKFYKEREKHIKEAKKRVGKESTKLVKARDKLGMLQHKAELPQLQTTFITTKQQLDKYVSTLPVDEQIVFQTGDQTADDISRDIGSLHYSIAASGKSGKSFQLELIDKSGPTKLQTVSVITPCGEVDVCIGGVKHKTIQLVNLTRPSTPLNEFTVTFYDFTSSADGSLLYITDFKNKCLQAVTKLGDLKNIKTFSPLLPTCVHVTSNHEIYVGIVESDSQNLDADSKRAILKLTPQGIFKSEFEFDLRGTRLFTVPYRCHVNETNKSIVVIDKYDPSTGRVIAFDETGEVKFRYSGFTASSKFKPFRPTNVSCTQMGETIICDIDNHSLHIIDKHGFFIQNLSTLEVGILHPHSMAIDSYDRLWIGTGHPPTDAKQKGQIYITRLTKK
ncbi:uncharacterized protein LOC127735964 [Mytilus californianus]|uniref:uncharacterized protein LOC127735964 n=1 Tax=Mytilus californianus TaxID=6549 RepID=UPI002246CFAD|nr:uncharacterized protein LOC127735964 [Mytilus californianus]